METGLIVNAIRRFRGQFVLLLGASMVVALLSPGTSLASPGLVTQDLTTLTPSQVANSLVGSGVTISNVTYTGANVAAGTFSGGTGIIGFESGVILSSGDIVNVVGPNQFDNITGVNSLPGDSDLTGLSGFATFDAAVLEFDFVPVTTQIKFSYVFASDEYNEFVNTQFNDVFAFFVNGTNCAVVGSPPVPVSINTINNGNPFGTLPNSHPELYINNDLSDGGAAIDTEMDGLTVVLTCEANVTANATNHLKMAIADASDPVLDADVFLKAGSIVSIKETSTTYTGDSSVQYSDSVALSGTLLNTSDSPNVGVPGKQLDFAIGTQTASAGPTDANGDASTQLVVTQMPGSVSTVETSFAGDGTFEPSNDIDPFSILKEDCTLAYTGDILVNEGTPTTLAAHLGEPDSSLGDRSNKTITFTLTDASGNTSQFQATTNANGDASVSVLLAPNVYSVDVSFGGDTFYLPCATQVSSVVTVQAAAAKVTGGGFISAGSRTNFGFNAIHDAEGLHGQLQLAVRSTKSRFHADQVSSLSASGNTATWSGTGVFNGVSGFSFTVSVVDNGSPGKKGDTISIVVTSPDGSAAYSTGGPQPLKGGNITVH